MANLKDLIVTGSARILGTLYADLVVGGYQPPLLQCIWSDHLIEDQSWSRADTFTWQDGNVYKNVYDTLLAEFNAGEEATSGDNITFKKSSKGYRICDETQESALVDLYASKGIAWYYILDTTNKRFKLPRTKWGFKGYRDTVGLPIDQSLPDHQHIYQQGGNACQGGWDNYWAYGRRDDSRAWTGWASESNSTYKSGAPVQERGTQMYLYFYVGEFTRSALAQTAGINAEMFNNKEDADTWVYYENDTSGYRYNRKNGYCEQWGRGNTNNSITKIKLTKTMKNTSYTVLAGCNTSASFSSPTACNIVSTSEFELRCGGNTQWMWKVSGFLAAGQY